MFKGRMPSSKLFGRIGLILVISAITLTITAASTNAAAFSFIDSIKEFLGLTATPVEVTTTAEPQPQPMAPTGINLLTEDFSFSGLLSSNGWSVHSGTTNALSTTTGLTYSGYAGSGVGNAVFVGNVGGEDVNRGLSADQTGNGTSVYASFLVNVNDASLTESGDVFFHLGDRASATNFTLFAARVFCRIVSGNVNFGLSNTSTATYGATNFAKNTTYLLIVKYTINTAGNDSTQLWVIPSGVPATEAAAGTAEVSNTGTSGQDTIDAVGIRQGSNNQPSLDLDGLRVGTTWDSSVTTPSHQLTVTRAGTSLGSVTSSPSGIDCGAVCSASFDEGTPVTLTAPDLAPGHRFIGWSGSGCTGTGQCQVTMDAPKSVTATYVAQHQLSVSTAGTGSGRVMGPGIVCPGDCDELYDENSVVTITATADPGSSFSHWTGEPCAGLPENCDVTMSQARSVTAFFVDATPPVVSIVSTDPNPTTSGTTLTWDADEDGLYRVKVNQTAGEQCDAGVALDSGSFVAGTGPRVLAIPLHVLHRGSNTIRVCVRDAAGNTGEASTTVQMQSCTAPDNGTGTADHPECRFLGGPMPVFTPPPPGQPTMAVGSLDSFAVTRSPGGSLGGDRDTGQATMRLAILAGVAIPKFLTMEVVMDSGPRTPGDPVQSFTTEMFRLAGQLPAGDPDFDLLRIRGGSDFGMPSPGHTTLIRESPTRWSVDSFFDVFYTIDYVGRAGGPFSGMSGSTTIRASAAVFVHRAGQRHRNG